jgi:hypothetical protein
MTILIDHPGTNARVAAISAMASSPYRVTQLHTAPQLEAVNGSPANR